MGDRYLNSQNARNIDVDESGDVLVTGRGVLSAMHLGNASSGDLYVKLYDQVDAPDETDTPIATFLVASVAPEIIPLPDGLFFNLGLGVRATTGVADADVGAPAANDLVGNFFFRKLTQ